MTKLILPSKSDLMKVLYEFRVKDSSQLTKLHEVEDKADSALARFEETNKTYLKLVQAAKVAYDARYALYKVERGTKQEVIQRCRNLIRLKGPTPEVIAEVAKLVGVEL